MGFLEKYLTLIPEEKKSKAVISFLAAMDAISEKTPEIAMAIVQELKDQRSYVKLIASENFSSLSSQLAMGNLLTDKYAEGYPEKRFYAGCDNVDSIEKMAVEELIKLFGCDHAYVQPHSGADANLVAFWSILVYRVQNKELEKLGKKNIVDLTPDEHERIRKLLLSQKMMGMSLNAGGHLTHGYRHNISSKIFEAVSYDVDPKTGLIDYKALKEQVQTEKPSVLIAGYSSYPRRLNFAYFKEIAESVGATLMVDMAHFAGLVAGKVLQGDENPIPFADIVTSTTHKTLRGPRGGIVLCKAPYQEIVDKGCPIVLGGPLPHVIAAKAIAFKEANTKEFCQYAQQIVKNARALAEGLMKRNASLTTGGTDNHLLVVDVAESFKITGRQAEIALRKAHLTLNRNAIPYDSNGPWYTSGIRIGTPAVTTLGMKEKEMDLLAELIVNVLKQVKPYDIDGKESKAQLQIDSDVLKEAQKEVALLLRRFPLYPEILID